MHTTTIRLPDSLWTYISAAAAEDGVSAAGWIRDSCLIRVAFQGGYALAQDDIAAGGRLSDEATAWARARRQT